MTKKEKSKLDKTVQTDKQIRFPVPPYEKPYTELQKKIRPGDVLTIWVRHFNKTEYILVERDIEVVEVTFNVLIYIDDEGQRRGTPWWAIHNWEVEETDV